VISPGWPTMRSGSSNRRQHAPKPSNYDISTLLRCDITTLLLQRKTSIISIMSNIEHRFAAKLRGNQSIPVPGTATTDSNVASPERLTASSELC
ncbi:hypothetical protein K7N18_28410, partial [Burkholderia arboris]|uniref:hypothetical protein n=1 Tax=Burkholderia arboris TaxID=488730 RepID=UPI001CA3A4F0